MAADEPRKLGQLLGLSVPPNESFWIADRLGKGTNKLGGNDPAIFGAILPLPGSPGLVGGQLRCFRRTPARRDPYKSDASRWTGIC